MKTLLRQLEFCRGAIASHLLTRNPQLTESQLNRSVPILIHLFLFLLLAEQRGLLFCNSLRKLQESQGTRGINDRFCQLLQDLHNQYGFLLPPDCLILSQLLDDALLRDILSSLMLHQSMQSTVVPIEILGQGYEKFLSQPISLTGDRRMIVAQQCKTRKATGVYYTPSEIVQYIVQSTLGTLLGKQNQIQENGKLTLHVLDPACGGGIFLLAAYQFLLDWYLQYYRDSIHNGMTETLPIYQDLDGSWHLTYSERAKILLNHVYGVDIDPQAVEVTKLSLILKLLEGKADRKDKPLPNLSHNLQCGNALMEFDWGAAFPEVMGSHGFDTVIGNPPYIDSEWMTQVLPHWRKYCTQHYRTATGNWDLFCVFIEKAWQLCKPGGLTSFVVPNKLASADYAAQVRSLLVQESQLLSIRDYSHVPVFPVAVYPLVYLSHKQSPNPQSTIRYERMQGLEAIGESHDLPYAHYNSEPEKPWCLLAHPQLSNLMAKLQRDFPPLTSIAQVLGAATVAEAYAMRSLIQDDPEDTPGNFKVVNSGILDRYCILWGRKRLRYLGSSYWHPIVPSSAIKELPTKRRVQTIQPKIIVAGMSRRLECAVDLTGSIVAGKSTSVIFPTIDLRYLLGVLNSHLINLYFTSKFQGNSLQGGYLRVGPPQLRAISIPQLDLSDRTDQSHYYQMIELVDQILGLYQSHQTIQDNQDLQKFSRQMIQLDDQIDRLVYKLYRLTEAEIAILRNSG